MTKSPSAWIALGLKLLITTVLLWYLLGKVRVGPLVSQLASMRPLETMGAVLLTLLQLALGSLRWRSISGLLEVLIRPMSAFRFTLIGQFFNQLLPTAFGGDAVRAWLASKDRAELGRAVRAVLCDRIAGLVVLLVIIAAIWALVPGLGQGSIAIARLSRWTALSAVVGVPVLYGWGPAMAARLEGWRWTRVLGRLVQDVHAALFSRTTRSLTWATSLAAHLAAVVAIWLCAKSMGNALDFGSTLALGPLIVLVSMAPVSLAGWGVREGAMVVGLGALGIAADHALAVSVGVGLVQIAAGIPGGLLWLAGPRRPSLRPVGP